MRPSNAAAGRAPERPNSCAPHGMVSVNAVIAFANMPALPFGAVGASGFGRIHGADRLREFARPQSITRCPFRTPIEPTSFARTQGAMKLPDRYVALRFGRRARVKRPDVLARPTHLAVERTLDKHTPSGHDRGL